jgi:antitoxin (DNA-binding transcriptional repressor) of toxin-antitoxin stability system
MWLVKTVERVGIKHLKNSLSSYIQQVRRGVRVLVTDRGEVVAELGRPRSDVTADSHPLVLEWVAAGKMRPAPAKKKKLPLSPVKLPAGTARRLLDADRGR